MDVSAYKPLKWVEREGESCKTEFVKKCVEKRENVCAKVVETQCEVVPYTECSLGMEDQTYSETELAPKLFVEKSCVQGHKTVPHIKQVSRAQYEVETAMFVAAAGPEVSERDQAELRDSVGEGRRGQPGVGW